MKKILPLCGLLMTWTGYSHSEAQNQQQSASDSAIRITLATVCIFFAGFTAGAGTMFWWLSRHRNSFLVTVGLALSPCHSYAQLATNTPQVANALRGVAAIEARTKILNDANAKLREQEKDTLRLMGAKAHADDAYRINQRNSAERKRANELRAVQIRNDAELNKLEVNRLQLESFLKSAGVTNYPGARPAAAKGKTRK